MCKVNTVRVTLVIKITFDDKQVHNINTIISQNETKAPKQPWNKILSTNISSKVCCQKMFDLKCKWLQWSSCSWSHLEATSRLQENQSTIGHLQRSFFCCLIFLIRDGKDHIEHQWLMMISRSGSCVIVSGPIWTWQSRTTIGYDFDTTKKRWPSKRRHRCVDDTQWCVSHWGSHLTGLAALNEGAFHVLQPEERDTLGLMGDWGEMNGPKQKEKKCLKRKKTFDHWSLGQF